MCEALKSRTNPQKQKTRLKQLKMHKRKNLPNCGPKSWTQIVDPTCSSDLFTCLVDPTCGALETRSCSRSDSWIVLMREVFDPDSWTRLVHPTSGALKTMCGRCSTRGLSPRRALKTGRCSKSDSNI